MKKIVAYFVGLAAIFIAACDLQPKIVSLPDTVGEFISSRYPALLADPETQPEIYNSAASDYGVYASPTLYGSVESSDYVEYASVNDYIVPPSDNELYGVPPSDADVDSGAPIVADNVASSDMQMGDYIRVPMYGSTTTVPTSTEITVAAGDTLYSLAVRHNISVDELARANGLTPPYGLYVGQKLTIPSEVEAPFVQTVAVPVKSDSSITPNTKTRVQLREITVAAGDTLYSLSRRYSVPVNDLAVMNDLSAPFTLSIGQKLKVPDLSAAPVRTANIATTGGAVSGHTPVAASSSTVSQQPKEKISSDPNQKLPTITARSSSKFSWPVRGNILSHYGAKSGGLFNDGINIGAARGTAVKAAENGVVAYAGNEVKGMGNLIIIQHSGGWMTVYAHMDAMDVRRGTKVSVGQKVGTVGATGKVDQPQLHFEIRKGTKAYNPSSYLK